jgi:hypothetical protein
MLIDNRDGETETLGDKPAQLSMFTEENSYDLGRVGGRQNDTVVYLRPITDVFQLKIY